MFEARHKEGIGTGAVLRVPGRVPGLYLIQTDETGERRFFYSRDSAPVRQLFNMPETPQVQAALTGSLVYLSGITLSLFDDESRNRLFDTLDLARRQGCQVAFDTNFRPRGWPDLHTARAVFDRMFGRSDIVLASVEDHLSCCTGPASWPPIFIARLQDGASVGEMVVKLALIPPATSRPRKGGDRRRGRAGPPTLWDTTAAGDSFAAAYLAARLGAGADPRARRTHRASPGRRRGPAPRRHHSPLRDARHSPCGRGPIGNSTDERIPPRASPNCCAPHG